MRRLKRADAGGIITLDQLLDCMENASYGGVLSIAGYVAADVAMPRGEGALTMTGCFQVGIIDYLGGSGHTVTVEGTAAVDMRQGSILDLRRYGIPFDTCCGFVRSYFRFSGFGRGDLPPRMRSWAPTIRMPVAA